MFPIIRAYLFEILLINIRHCLFSIWEILAKNLGMEIWLKCISDRYIFRVGKETNIFEEMMSFGRKTPFI